ncbi:MAG: malonyl-ACP O-methyltransferase BioC [Tannerellaceae bacterium]|nr:malonyl-ACP O-methyltransferase BioC [Tannerellaceae bacterium]
MERPMLTPPIDTQQVCRRFSRAIPSYDRHARAQQQICHRLAGLVSRYAGDRFGRILEIGCGTGGFTRLLKQQCQVEEWVINDLCAGYEKQIREIIATSGSMHFIAGDAEKIAFGGKFDLILSASAIQWFTAPEAFLKRLGGNLPTGKTLILSTFVPGNLQEIHTLTGRGLVYPEKQLYVNWLNNDFNLLYNQEEEIVLTFDDPYQVLQHLKYTGVTATGSGSWTRKMVQDFSTRYRNLFSTGNNQVKLTYRPLYLVAVKK